MDDLCGWFEVIRSILPPSYEMRLVRPEHVILIESRTASVRVREEDLAGKHPQAVIALLRRRLDSRRLVAA